MTEGLHVLPPLLQIVCVNVMPMNAGINLNAQEKDIGAPLVNLILRGEFQNWAEVTVLDFLFSDIFVHLP